MSTLNLNFTFNLKTSEQALDTSYMNDEESLALLYEEWNRVCAITMETTKNVKAFNTDEIEIKHLSEV